MATEPANIASNSAMLVQLTNDGVPKLHCPICNKALVSLNGYVKHVKKHEPPGGFLCRYCEARFCSEEELKSHTDEVHTTLACRVCKATFVNVEDYREHIRVIHNGIDREMFKCEKCGAVYKTQEPFKRHMETQCNTIKAHKCEQCGMTFVTKYNLKQHVDTHSAERRFCCSYCGKGFVQKGRLVEHERSHTGQKPYKCDVCGKCFAHRESIVTHSSIHTGIRLVECRCCSNRFSCYSNLIKHRRARPDTCGLPEYDPPKTRGRNVGSRIPPTLNPTSEIKVSNLNKIIKPDDQIHLKKKEAIAANKPKITVRKRSGVRPGPKSERKKQTSFTEAETEEDSDEEEFLQTSGEDTLENSQTEKEWNIDSEESDNIYNDPIDSESDADDKPLKELQESIEKSVNIKEEHLDDDAQDFLTSDFMESTLKVKNEENDLLNSLINDDDDGPMVKVENVLIEIAEDMMFENETPEVNADEDVLAVREMEREEDGFLGDSMDEHSQMKNVENTRIKRGDTIKATIKRTRKTKKKLNENIEADDDDWSEKEKFETKRKYRRRNDPENENTRLSKRVGTLSAAELRKRLQVFKRDGKTFKCPSKDCVKLYHMRKPFERHLREEHDMPEEEIREYMKGDDVGVVNEEIFKCHICDKIYLMEKRLMSHMELHGFDGKLIHRCPCYCKLFFASKEEALEHAHQAHRDTLYCEICDKYLNGHDGLKNHMRKYHTFETSPKEKSKTSNTSKRNFVCDKCGKKFSARTSLMDHVRSDCGKNPLYPCNICGKHLTTAGILKTHLLLHKDETPYQCDQCGKTFKVKAQYKTHIKTRHTDYKPFKCHLCPKAYPYRESLLIHMTVHTGIKRFMCNGCGKRFTCVSNLQAHRKVHADTCGLLPLNAKATQYMGVQKGNLLLGAKPEAGIPYAETNTLVAKEVIDRDLPMAQDINFPSEPSAPLATVPLAYAQSSVTMNSPTTVAASQIFLPHISVKNFDP